MLALLRDEITKLLETAYAVSSDDIPQAISLAEKALFKSQKIKKKNAIHADGLLLLSDLQRKNKEFNTSKSLAERALDISISIDYDKGIADGQLNIAKALLNLGKLSDAIPYLLDASLNYRKANNLTSQGKSILLIGSIYDEFKDYKNAVSTYKDVLELSKSPQNKYLASEANLYLADLHYKIDRNARADSYIQKTIILKQEVNDQRGLAKAHLVNGKIHSKNNKLDTAEEELKKALALYERKENIKGIVHSKIELGNIYYLRNDAQNATEFLQNAIITAEQNQLNESLYRCNYLLYLVHKKTDVAKSLQYLEKYLKVKETQDKKYIQSMIDSYGVISQIEDNEKVAEKELELASIIEKKNTEMDSFFYRVSHDLKGPIASLLGLSDLAKRDVADEKSLVYIKMFENQVKRLNMIVMELINITELNYREIKRTDINFYEIVDSCITSYTYLPNFESIQFKIEVESNLKFSSEWYIINTILQNLIENSIKYLDKEKKESFVEITIHSTKSDVVLIVKDNGQGVGKEHQIKIFDMFYRANNNADGTGLGLFILKRAVERLKGEIKLESELNIGTTFTISLPFVVD
jgi:hypothetical protein